MTQKEKVLNHLEKHGTIDTWTCFTKYRITRLSEYIRQLRDENYLIISEWIKPKKGNQYVKYNLVQKRLIATNNESKTYIK